MLKRNNIKKRSSVIIQAIIEQMTKGTSKKPSDWINDNNDIINLMKTQWEYEFLPVGHDACAETEQTAIA